MGSIILGESFAQSGNLVVKDTLLMIKRFQVIKLFPFLCTAHHIYIDSTVAQINTVMAQAIHREIPAEGGTHAAPWCNARMEKDRARDAKITRLVSHSFQRTNVVRVPKLACQPLRGKKHRN
jgi:hypothetical protein